jgi:hypothetical protein
MKKIILLSFLMILSIQVLQAQSIFIKSGRNLTNYKFGNATSESPFLQNEIGQSYEFGYISNQPSENRFYYGLSLGLEEYNASGGQYSTNALVWETNYANFKGLGYYRLYSNEKSAIAIKGGLGLATLIHGRQQINGARFDLLKQDEFKGLFLSPQLGLSYTFSIDKSISLLLDYDYGRQFSLTNGTEQKLSFINHSLSLGFSVNIN